MQRATLPGVVAVGLPAGLSRDVVPPIYRSEHVLHQRRADVLRSHQVVHQLIVVPTRAHSPAHLDLYCLLMLTFTLG